MWRWAKEFDLVGDPVVDTDGHFGLIVEGSKEVEITQVVRERLGIPASASIFAGPRVEVPWVILMAWDAINTWAGCPGLSNPFVWQEVYVWPPKFDWPIWFPQYERWECYSERVLADFRNHLKKYGAESNARYRAHNPPVTRNSARSTVEARYTWTALHVCRRWKYQKIADDHNPDLTNPLDPKSIGAQVRAVCELIRLPS
jgi:hypothetical protein